MSLLLEALKKAELAKQAAKESAAPASTPPFTRDKLPDISQPVEIHSDDLSPVETNPPAKTVEKPVLELAPEEPPRATPASPAAPARAAIPEVDYSAPSESVERKQAQQLFEAKELDVNPRKPFYLTLAGLGVFALGTVGYFWYEMQPKNVYKLPPPSAQAPAAAQAPVAAPVAPATPAAPPAATETPAATTVPPAPSASAVAATVPPGAPATTPAAAASKPARAPAVSGVVPAAAPRPVGKEGSISVTHASVRPDPVLESAYRAYNSGDLAAARENYEQVLRANPDSRDALLGLAAMEVQARHYDVAEGYYQRLLVLDPRDAYAQAGLIGLRGQVDPLAAESRLKTMIAAQPDASFLNFSLGNQYAAQGRWAEAQQAYFQAYSGDPEHPDFAYNLAVSLDRMHQTKQALEYYRRALALADGRPLSFDKAQVEKRVAQLAR